MNIMNLVGTQVSMCKFVIVSVCGLSPSHTPFIPSNLFSSRFGSEEVWHDQRSLIRLSCEPLGSCITSFQNCYLYYLHLSMAFLFHVCAPIVVVKPLSISLNYMAAMTVNCIKTFLLPLEHLVKPPLCMAHHRYCTVTMGSLW